ncbi:hypothetical protein G9A89_009245 [Geosiphon pyriformis]|nr:hypothetical protein G9A89_009245 [Geosiphon pyriformis]
MHNISKPFLHDYEATVGPSIVVLNKSIMEPGFNISNSETGNTTESESVNIKEKFLVKKTSFDYGEDGIIAGKNLKQTLKSSKIQTKRALGKPLEKIDFLGNNNDNILLDKSAVIVKKIPIRTLAEAVHTALSEFGMVVLIKIQLVELWQKAVVKFGKVEQTDLVMACWFILIGKDAVHVARADQDKKS